MSTKGRLMKLHESIDNKFSQQFGFRIRNVTFTNIANYLHVPKDASSLAVTRILFGLCMLFDIPHERGGANLDWRWGRDMCFFPLFPFLKPLPLPVMAAIYAAMWLGAFCIMLGYRHRFFSTLFTICYWYLFLIEKSYWNNHSYLFGLVAFLLACTEASCFWSLDAYLHPSLLKRTVPYWNYFLLKYQFFILYFMAGVKKGTAEWLTGYSVQSLSKHWVFDPFKIFLTVDQIDYLIVHWFIFVFDLTVAFWMMWGRTRNVAMLFCALFHLMNSRLFQIGMFPWVCLATMPLFYPFDWPKKTLQFLRQRFNDFKGYICNNNCTVMKSRQFYNPDNHPEDSDDDSIDKLDENEDQDVDKIDNNYIKLPKNENSDAGTFDPELEKNDSNPKEIQEEISDDAFIDDTKEDVDKNNLKVIKIDEECNKCDDADRRKVLTTLAIFFYVVMQAFLPFSHFITKGYNNWTNGLYGYSWDMMVHTWDSHSVVVKLVDNNNGKEFFIDPSLYTPNDRWTRHGDMVYQYAQCLNNKITNNIGKADLSTTNISIYIDIWYSLNGRFAQRIFEPKVDILKAGWSPFARIPYLMPLLDEALDWRRDLDVIRKEVYSWRNDSEVSFLADFQGYSQEKYVPVELENVSLTVLQGTLVYNPKETKNRTGQSFKITCGNRIKVVPGAFHSVHNIGNTPAYYMYTFVNATANFLETKEKPKLPVVTELFSRFSKMVKFAMLLVKCIFVVCFTC